MTPGLASSTPKLIDMPTAMKNSPSSRPLKGSMSVSSSRRYSLSASSTPARKAPSAIDRPTNCISAAMATTSSSAAAVKISGVSLRAIQRRIGRSSSRPPRMMPAITPTIFSASSARSSPLMDCSAAVAPARSGSSARIGIAATSWNSRIEKPAWPLGVFSRLRSPNTCSAMAVDDSASPSAATSATRHGAPTAQPTANSTAAQLSTCADPQPKIGRRRLHRRLGSSSRPTRNSISTTPNSAKCSTSSTLDTRPRPQGPMAMPATR
ncbi:hypothetical protein FQZ97_621570 [compost metagenome]